MTFTDASNHAITFVNSYHRGQSVRAIAMTDRDHLEWLVMRADAPVEDRQAARVVLGAIPPPPRPPTKAQRQAERLRLLRPATGTLTPRQRNR